MSLCVLPPKMYWRTTFFVKSCDYLNMQIWHHTPYQTRYSDPWGAFLVRAQVCPSAWHELFLRSRVLSVKLSVSDLIPLREDDLSLYYKFVHK